MPKPKLPELHCLLYPDAIGASGSFYDWNPSGGLILDAQGNVALVGGLGCHIPQRAWETPTDFDLALLRLVKRAAELRPLGIIPVSPKQIPRVFCHATLPEAGSFRQFVGSPKALDVVKSALKDPDGTVFTWWPTDLIKGKVVYALGYPENVGRTVGPSLKSMGAGIIWPEAVLGMKLVPEKGR